MAPAQKPPPIRPLSVIRASTIAIRPVRWLWDDRISLGTLCLIGGREGVGKSLVTYTLAAQVTRGTLPGVYLGQPRGVIVVASEDSWEHTIVPRLIGAGADLDLIYRLTVNTPDGQEGELELPCDLEELERIIGETSSALVMLDPLLSRLAHDLDTHKDADVRRALEPLVKLSNRSSACFIGLIHVNKSTSADPLTMLMGSRAFTAVSRAVLFVMTDPNDASKRLLGQAKNNLGRMDVPTLSFQIIASLVATTEEGEVWTGRVDWLGDSEFSLHDAIAATSATAQDKSDRADASAWLSDELSSLEGPMDSAKVKRAATAAGHSLSTLHRARTALHVVVTSAGFPKRTYWTLPASSQNGHHADSAIF